MQKRVRKGRVRLRWSIKTARLFGPVWRGDAKALSAKDIADRGGKRPAWDEMSAADFLRRIAEDYDYRSPRHDRLHAIAERIDSAWRMPDALPVEIAQLIHTAETHLRSWVKDARPFANTEEVADRLKKLLEAKSIVSARYEESRMSAPRTSVASR